MRSPHEACWAKTSPTDRPGISVVQHCRTAGIVAQYLARQCPAWLGDALSVQTGVALAAIHDVGKVCPGFQAKCPAWLQTHPHPSTELAGAETDHAKVGQRVIQEVLGEDARRFWAAIVGAHHGKLKGDILRTLCDGGPEWNSERLRLIEEMMAEFGPLPSCLPSGPDCAELWFNAGLIVVADWLASDERSFPPTKVLDSDAIRERVERQMERIGFQPARIAGGIRFPTLFGFEPNPLQSLFASVAQRPGVYVVEAPMGCGKTEAALLAAYGLLSTGQATGVYFALPTQTTSNRIHRRVESFLGRLGSDSKARLVHGNSWLMDGETPPDGKEYGDPNTQTTMHDGRDWFASSRRALLAPFGVGTVDQALLGVVAAKHFFVRQFALAGKVVILDEVHSYDLYTGTLLDQLIGRLRALGGTIIVLSATLTAARRRELIGQALAEPAGGEDYPLITCDGPDGARSVGVESHESKTVAVRFKRQDELVGECLSRARDGQCVLWIRNTVHDAQETYRQLLGRNQTGGPKIALLHARFPQFRRAELEEEWLDCLGKDQARRPTGGCVLVATQVAEQSVDIDADLLITDLAPTDMLLQRMGRLWRHPRPRPGGCERAEAWIALPSMDLAELREANVGAIREAFGKSGRVYAPYVLLRSLEVWRERVEIAIPSELRQVLEATYAPAEDSEPGAWRELWHVLEGEKNRLRQRALSASSVWQVALDDREGVQTRWNSCPTVGLLVLRRVFKWDRVDGDVGLLNGDRIQLKRCQDFDYHAAQAIHRNLVKVPRWAVRSHLGRTPDWLKGYVREDLLVCKCVDGELVVLPAGEGSGLSYREDLGVVLPEWKPAGGSANTPVEVDDDESYD